MYKQQNENIENVATEATVAKGDHTVIKLAVPTQNIISTRMNLCHYKPETKIQTIEEQSQGKKLLALMASLKPEITEPEMSAVEKDAFLYGKSDYLYIYPEMINSLLDNGLIEDLGAALSIHYYGLFDKLLIEIAENEYIITDRHLYARTGEVLDLSVVLKKFALYDNYADKSKRHQVKLPKRNEYKEYFQYASTISLPRLLVVLMENGDILKNNVVDRRYISINFEIHHEGMTWCDTLKKMIYMTKEEHKYAGHESKHREVRRIIRTGADMIEMMKLACA